MKKSEILVICSHQEILNTIIRLINTNPLMNGTGTNNIAEAITIFNSAAFDLVLVGSGLETHEEAELVKLTTGLRSSVPLVFHYGGGSGLLFAEIFEGLAKK